MQFLNNKHYKVLDQDTDDELVVDPPRPRVNNECRPFHKVAKLGQKLLFFARNMRGLHAESEAYTEYLEEGLDRQPDLAWTGCEKIGEREVITNNAHYVISQIRIGATILPCLPCVAQRLALREKYDERTYEALCVLEKISFEDAVKCKIGTMEYTLKLKEIQAEQQRRAKLPIHFILDHQTDTTKPPIDHVLLTVPPKISWHHMDNELYITDQPEDMPELDEEWSKVRDQVEIVSDFKNITWSHKKASKLPASIKPNNIDHITHARYGSYGTFRFDIKKDLYVQVISTLDGLLAKPTASNSMDTPIPAFLPRWNRRDNFTIAMGAAGRIGREPVPDDRMDRDTMEPYINKAVDFIIRLLEEKGMHRSVITPEDSWKWLASANFPNLKKISYMEAFKRVIRGGTFIPASDFDNTHKAFPKNENYLEGSKPQRMILAGSLEMAAVLAPLCAILGNYFFSTQYTSKKIPEVERPRLAIERFGDVPVILNDMSAFEGSIDTWMKNHIEHRIMKYFFPDAAPWIDRCNERLRIRCQDVRCVADSIRCSGDPQTSLGNSFTNLASIFAAFMYATDSLDMTFEDCKNRIVAWVEGDDSLVKLTPELFNNQVFERYMDAFFKMGFATKMEVADFVGDAGYCSMFFNRELTLCPRVGQTFLDFPWDHSSKINRGVELLAMKALSLHHTSPGQPLTWALCRHYSPQTDIVTRLPFNSYEFEELQREGYNPRINGEFIDVNIPAQILGIEPDDRSRTLFWQKYNISPNKQIALEKRILKMGVIGLVKKTPTSHNDWIYLSRICDIDGIDLYTARQYYKDRSNVIEDIPDPKSSYKICRGDDNKVCIKNIQEQQHVEADGDTAVNCFSTPIDPLTYRSLKFKNSYKLRTIAHSHRHYFISKIISSLTKRNLRIAGIVFLSPSILYSAIKIYSLISAMCPLCHTVINEAFKLPGRFASLSIRLFSFLKWHN